jgi:hypothetical protein
MISYLWTWYPPPRVLDSPRFEIYIFKSWVTSGEEVATLPWCMISSNYHEASTSKYKVSYLWSGCAPSRVSNFIEIIVMHPCQGARFPTCDPDASLASEWFPTNYHVSITKYKVSCDHDAPLPRCVILTNDHDASIYCTVCMCTLFLPMRMKCPQHVYLYGSTKCLKVVYTSTLHICKIKLKEKLYLYAVTTFKLMFSL